MSEVDDVVRVDPVPVWLWFEPEAIEWHASERFVDEPNQAPGDEQGVAVAYSIFSDPAFVEAVRLRASDIAGYDYPEATEVLRAVRDELRARAGEDA